VKTRVLALLMLGALALAAPGAASPAPEKNAVGPGTAEGALPPLPAPRLPQRRKPEPPPGAAEVALRAMAGYNAVAPRAALVFDVKTGEPLFSLNGETAMPVASLTKMMTALLIAEGHSPTEQVLISEKAASVPGSRIGVLPKGKSVPLGPVFVGMLLVSGNDAAEALAEHDAGSELRFVKRMNHRAKELGMGCTHYTTPHGLQDEGNYSCAQDLAMLARADLDNTWIRQTAGLKKVVFPFPIKGGKLEVANNDYFVQRGLPQIPGAVVTGLKTGYTDPAGRCYVITARRGGREIGVVLLHSPDPMAQVPALLARGFAAPG
jgi:D-alanyl-D-alanine carboxypeptidase (penicillin-binding protein 5/6)